MLELSQRTALITGVSGAIGSRLAATFGGYGARVIGTYRTGAAAAERAVAALPPDRRSLIQADLGDAAASRLLWQQAAAIADIDTLVINAAALLRTPLSGEDSEAWDSGWEQSLNVNVVGAATLMREAAAAFSGRGFGSIITISSWAGQQGSRIPDLGAYAASKAALRNFGQTLARAYAKEGVRVYTIAPGVVDTGMGTADLSTSDIQAVADGLAMGHHVDAQEIAELAAFLATDRAPSLTGSTLDLNGASYLR
ncbi:MAG: SDR family oxidoreductase [Salinibacterium sp.]|nr:SDR family oxidoreductase [Salinibacterium sp.]